MSDIDLLLAIWVSACVVFLGFPSIYYVYMRNKARKPWEICFDRNYRPSVAILVPVRNEEETIRLKMLNLSRLLYPADRIETIIVNDASADNTLEEIREYITGNKNAKIRVLSSTEHVGKTSCLNNALKHVKADIIVVSDADCFLPSDILIKAMPYLSNSEVGAITGRELLLNPGDSWVTAREQFYNNTVQTIRVGESKLHSTIFFQGGFAAYKSRLLNEFDHETDDSGTALNIVQSSNRTLLIPEIGFYTVFPTTWAQKFAIKVRRANQLQRIWIKCLKMLLSGKLVLPTTIALPEAFMHVFNPIVFVVVALLSVTIIIQRPMLLLGLLLVLVPSVFMTRMRTIIVETLQNNCILLAAMAGLLTKKRFRLWRTEQQSRLLLNEEMLKEKQLI